MPEVTNNFKLLQIYCGTRFALHLNIGYLGARLMGGQAGGGWRALVQCIHDYGAINIGWRIYDNIYYGFMKY